MRDVHARRVRVSQDAPDIGQQSLFSMRVQCRGRFIKKKYGRILENRAGKGDALLFAT